MIDTITFNCSIPILPDSIEALQSLFKDHKSGSSKEAKGNRIIRTTKWSFSLLGLRLFSTEPGRLTKIECELPCLLWGHNGRLIQDQNAIDKALQVLRKILQFISPTDHKGEYSTIDLGHVCRIDLAWQYDRPVQDLKTLLQHAKHPRIQSPPDLYGNGNLSFNGKSLRISIYDKLKKEKDGRLSPTSAQNACRIECQIKSKKYIAERFGLNPDEGLRTLKFNDLYEVFRGLLLGFSQPRQLATVSTNGIVSFLAVEAQRDPEIIDRYIHQCGLSKRTASELKHKITDSKLSFFNLHELVPAGGPPPLVEVEHQNAEKKHHDFIREHGEALGILGE